MQTNHSAQEVKGRKVEVNDLYSFRLLSDVQLSPDGRVAAFVQTRMRKKKNDYASNIWLLPLMGSGVATKFTGSNARDMSPRWSADSEKIAFVSTRSGKPQVWVIPVKGGEARQLTRLKRGVGELAWSPDGKWIAFTATVDNEADKKAAAEAKEKEGSKEGKDSSADEINREPGAGSAEGLALPRVTAGEWEEDEEDEKEPEEKGDHAKSITRLYFKADGTGLVERRTHLFLIPSDGGKPEQLTEGEWDVQSPRWSPDGKEIAYLSNKEADADYISVNDLFVLSLENGKAGDTRQVTAHDSSIFNAEWLPGGSGFALFAHSRIREGALGTNVQVWTVSEDGEIRKLTEGFDRAAGSWVGSDLRSGGGEFRPRFSPDGKTIFFQVTNGGAVQIYSVPVSGGEVKQVVSGQRQIYSFDVAGNAVCFIATTPTNPNDLYRADLDGGNERKLTDVNGDLLGNVELSEPQEFWLDRPGGERVQGWIMMPPQLAEGRNYPMILEIHGGPHTAYGGAYFHEFQLLAAHGNIVLYTNPRGSQGYGQRFSDSITNDWGGVDYDDLVACVDYAMSQVPVDAERLGVAGGSYGGYMTAWIIGHTQRFKAAVAMRAVINLYSAWGSGDGTWMLWNWEFEGTPQERLALYMERSPITYVSDMRTPLLITHAEDDYRVNIEQADELFTALKYLKRDVEMLRFPVGAGGHDLSRSGKPSLRIERLEGILSWFDKYLGEGAMSNEC
ncbi:MAG: S9 family peptidase [Chloroflexi bacterium]|nr:S9 family peptidase [Chloroflexota bacterium]